VNPEVPNAHYHLGLIYRERGELTRAAAFFQRALEVDPADRDARYWLDRLTLMLQETVQTNDPQPNDRSGERAGDGPEEGFGEITE
jgi:tetratricopeptide (TPR) repeat protein